MANIPKAQRRQAVLLQIRQWSSFSRTDWLAVFDDNAASVWIWDKDKVDQAVETAKLNRRRVTVLPEVLLYGEMDEGRRLVKTMDGVEGQIWQGGTLTHSRWWPELPDLAGWNAFLRDGGQSAADAVPAPFAMEYLDSPWGRTEALLDDFGWRYENALVMAGFSLLAATSCWFLVKSIQISGKIDEEKKRFTLLEQRARPIQNARQQAIELRERIGFLRELDPYPPQIVLQAEIGKRLPKDGTFIKEWDFRGGKLKIMLVSPNKLQASAFVKAYQEAGWFKGVQAPSGSDPNLLALEMDVLRTEEIPRDIVEGKTRATADADKSRNEPLRSL